MDMWTYQETNQLGTDLTGAHMVGYDVEAVDGSIGKGDDATYELGACYVVVDTGPWIFGKKVMLPASSRRSTRSKRPCSWTGRTKRSSTRPSSTTTR